MQSRRKARGCALQALYQCDTLADWSDQSIELFFENFTDCADDNSRRGKIARDYSLLLIRGVREHLADIDEIIEKASSHWPVSRMLRVDRNLIRLAAFEMAYLEEIPPRVSINEAIEIAKIFGAEDSSQFINGVLDKIAVTLNEDSIVSKGKVELPFEVKRAVNFD